MPLHLKKLCVGVNSVEELVDSISRRERDLGAVYHTTRHQPRRWAEILFDDSDMNGSLFWVINGLFQCRQRLLGIEEGAKDDGSKGWRLVLEPQVHLVETLPHRPFQGWRYLEDEKAPRTLRLAEKNAEVLPLHIESELQALGLRSC